MRRKEDWENDAGCRIWRGTDRLFAACSVVHFIGNPDGGTGMEAV